MTLRGVLYLNPESNVSIDLFVCSTRRKLSVQVLGNPDGIKIQEQEGNDNGDHDEEW